MEKILLLCDNFNSLTQRVYTFLKDLGYVVSVEFAISPKIMIEAVELFNPDIILAPYLTKKIPKEIFDNYPTFILHPGPVGDRGAWALDNALLSNKKKWGVTILEAKEEMDSGDIWSFREFEVPFKSKGYVYRTLVTPLGIEAIEELFLKRKKGISPTPNPLFPPHPKVTQKERKIDWEKDTTLDIVRKINASDNFPGVKDNFLGVDVYLFGAVPEEEEVFKGKPKEILAKRDGAILVKTVDGAVWIQQMTQIEEGIRKIKLPSTYVLKERLKGVKEKRIPLYVPPYLKTFKEITFYQKERVGFLGFEFYNGAMSSNQCVRLKYAFEVLKEQVDVLVLMGGEQFFSNGIHLSILEDSKKQGEDGWSNINAMNNLVKSILFSPEVVTITAFRGNAGAGGVFLGLASDIVFAKEGVVLNPHYKTLGLSGSEYHTYTLPKRVGEEQAKRLLEEALPISAKKAKEIGMVDHLFKKFEEVEKFALELANSERMEEILEKKEEELDEEFIQSLLEKELEKMYPQFWDSNSEFHKRRREFVYKLCPIQTPPRLAIHRKLSTYRFLT